MNVRIKIFKLLLVKLINYQNRRYHVKVYNLGR